MGNFLPQMAALLYSFRISITMPMSIIAESSVRGRTTIAFTLRRARIHGQGAPRATTVRTIGGGSGLWVHELIVARMRIHTVVKPLRNS